jgi:hypothetical protein
MCFSDCRSREFLWQEGHTAFATKTEADAEVRNFVLSPKFCHRDLYIEINGGGKARDWLVYIYI